MRGLSSPQRVIADFLFRGTDGLILLGFGVTSVVRNGAGDYTITLSDLVGAEVTIQVCPIGLGDINANPETQPVAGVFDINSALAGVADDRDCYVTVKKAA